MPSESRHRGHLWFAKDLRRWSPPGRAALATVRRAAAGRPDRRIIGTAGSATTVGAARKLRHARADHPRRRELGDPTVEEVIAGIGLRGHVRAAHPEHLATDVARTDRAMKPKPCSSTSAEADGGEEGLLRRSEPSHSRRGTGLFDVEPLLPTTFLGARERPDLTAHRRSTSAHLRAMNFYTRPAQFPRGGESLENVVDKVDSMNFARERPSPNPPPLTWGEGTELREPLAVRARTCVPQSPLPA